jgi:hypothetical protein
MKGYQLLLEGEFLNQVMGLATAHDELKYSIMHWIVNELKKDTEIRSLPIEIDVVKITFHGSTYPGIGIHYLNQKPGLNFTDEDNITDYGPLIEVKTEEIYRRNSFSNFFNYVYKNRTEIYQGLEDYKNE